jgi:predicted alpha-1,2-mannosidase
MKIRLYFTALLLFSFLLAGEKNCVAQSRIPIWQIGEKDNSAAEFALAPGDYEEFLSHDFGWEDRFYLVGKSTPKDDFPYILPGPDDRWGGTSGTAGIRTHVLNILFRMKSAPEKGDWKLIIDILDTHKEKPPYFKVTVNGRSWKQILPKGGGESLTGGYDKSINHRIEIPLEPGLIKKGGNKISLTNLEGSWLIFDQMVLEGPENAILENTIGRAYLRGVETADYQTKGNQPLLVDIEHLQGMPEVEVKVDDQTILTQLLEKGRYILEAPMPAIMAKKESSYVILVDGVAVEKGNITRAPQQEISLADYVDTRMGTAHSRWMIAPGPWMPFSMVKLSPDNQNSGWQAGYEPSFESIGTFSHIHEWTMGGLGIMPVNGPLKTRIGDQSVFRQDTLSYRSAIDKEGEVAEIGYYKADLTDYGIKAELTATTRCGFQRYTFPSTSDGRIMVDLTIPTEYSYNIRDARITRVSKRRIEGYSKQQSKGVWSSDADQDYTLFFVIEFDQDIIRSGGWINDTVVTEKEIHAENPDKMGYFVEFDTHHDGVVQVRSAISYVDLEGASRNLEEEIITRFDWNFEAVRKAQRTSWNEILSRISVESNNRREKTRFYTNLYRSYCRNMFSDVDGRWVDATEKVQQFDDPVNEVALGCDAFWNTFWNLNQLWNLITPEWSSQWVKSQLALFDANGMLAKGPAGMEFIPVMVAEHEIPLLVGAYQMGIRDYDVEKMYQAIKKMQTVPPRKIGNGLAGNRDIEAYLTYRFVPADKGRFSNTLEYSYDDWSVSQLAKTLGKEEDYIRFADRGNWWKNSIDPKGGFARMRYSNGEWEKDFDPFTSGANHHYVEGNAWQLTFFVPQDVPALAGMIGKERFLERLTWGFEASEPWRYNAPGDQYWDFPVVQGNQQSMHFAFLFNWVGEPWQTQRWSRSILDRYYGHDLANAYLGDEDQGQMSAWFVMAAIGLFQTDGGCSVDPHYEITSPLFEKIIINLGNRYDRGNEFTIRANGASHARKYIKSATLNGRELNSFRFPASELLKGGLLELEMSDQPNYQWGKE